MNDKRINEAKNRLIAICFVALYGSGFVGASYGLPYIAPFFYLTLRFSITALILICAIKLFKIVWPKKGYLDIILSGILLQGVFSAGVFYALYLGVKPAVSALIISLQPIIVWLLIVLTTKMRVRLFAVLSLLAGFSGVALIVHEGLDTQSLNWINSSLCILGLLGLAVGQFYHQMRNSDAHLLVIGFLQSASSAVIMAVGAVLFEDWSVVWSSQLILSLMWMIGGVSIGAIALLYILMRHNSADRVASIFYGVPISAALCAWLVLDQLPTTVDWIGFIIILFSIFVFNWDSRRDYSESRSD